MGPPVQGQSGRPLDLAREPRTDGHPSPKLRKHRQAGGIEGEENFKSHRDLHLQKINSYQSPDMANEFTNERSISTIGRDIQKAATFVENHLLLFPHQKAAYLQAKNNFNLAYSEVTDTRIDLTNRRATFENEAREFIGHLRTALDSASRAGGSTQPGPSRPYGHY